MLSTWPNLLARRDLLRQLTLTELKSTHTQTHLGWLWWLLDPLIMMCIYWGIMMGLFRRGAEHYQPYPIFILCGLLAWRQFSRAVNQSLRVLRSQSGLIKSVPFPTMVLPLSRVLSSFAFFLVGLGLLLVSALAMPNAQHSGNWFMLIQLLPLLLLQLAIAVGASLIVSCLGALVIDLQNVSTHVMRVGFYLSPGIYGLDLVHRATRDNVPDWLPAGSGPVLYGLYLVNPFASIITGYRCAIFYGTYLPPMHWAILIVEAGVLITAGYVMYQHYDRRVLKFL